ncbi:MAG: DUF4097 domain-containing protein [Treponema sp.]|nr:DUF4097 domain-containing protein [Treponema sp.]
MKKNILLAVLGVITIACIFYGSMRHMNVFDKNGFKDFTWNFSDDDISETGENDLDVDLEAFDSIKIDCKIAHITIEEGSSFRLKSSYNKEYLKPIYSVENKSLRISQKSHRGATGNNNCSIIITVPSGLAFDSIDIDSNVGDIYINNLTGKEIDADLNVGEIRFHEVNFDKIDIDNNVGEVSVSLADKAENYSMNLATDVGVVFVAGNSFKRNYNSNGKGTKKLSINTNVGEVTVK